MFNDKCQIFRGSNFLRRIVRSFRGPRPQPRAEKKTIRDCNLEFVDEEEFRIKRQRTSKISEGRLGWMVSVGLVQ